MNITLSIDDALAARAREVVRAEGISLNESIRRHLERVAGRRPGEQQAAEMCALWEAGSGHSGGRRIGREEAYEGRV